MSDVFLDYSQYYDLLYREKDYRGEAEFVVDLIRRQNPGARTILNIGCGTGNHDCYFTDAGFAVTGIDLSEKMLEIARRRELKGCEYILSDARSFRPSQRFDAIVSLFHVFSYQNSNDDALAYLKTMRFCLSNEGVGVFDYWYGPGVIHQKPADRVKQATSENLEIIRRANSEISYEKSLVNVNFEIEIKQKSPPFQQTLREVHRMRYYTCNEVEILSKNAELESMHFAWMCKDRSPGIDDWAAYSVVRPL